MIYVCPISATRDARAAVLNSWVTPVGVLYCCFSAWSFAPLSHPPEVCDVSGSRSPSLFPVSSLRDVTCTPHSLTHSTLSRTTNTKGANLSALGARSAGLRLPSRPPPPPVSPQSLLVVFAAPPVCLLPARLNRALSRCLFSSGAVYLQDTYETVQCPDGGSRQ